MTDIKQYCLIEAFKKGPAILFIGQSGCGKGTQTAQLIESYKEFLPGAPYLHSESGQLFRDRIPKFSEWNKERIGAIQTSGAFQSWVTATCLWATNFLMLYQGGPVFIDGSPRSPEEVTALIDFYCDYACKELIIFVLEIDDTKAEHRLVMRNKQLIKHNLPPRSDTLTPESRKKKLSFFHSQVVPALDFLEGFHRATVYRIDGLLPKEEISRQVLSRLSMYHS